MAEVSTQDSNKAIVQASFDRWKSGNGSPFELLVPDAEWTTVGSSPLSKTYHSRKEFLDEVGGPFDARMSKPPVRTVCAAATGAAGKTYAAMAGGKENSAITRNGTPQTGTMLHPSFSHCR
jgi:ketosteroid isomerase-like protein